MSFKIFPIFWLTPVSPYKPIRYSISLSVGYHPVCLRHRVPSTLRCVTPLQLQYVDMKLKFIRDASDTEAIRPEYVGRRIWSRTCSLSVWTPHDSMIYAR